MVVKPLLRHVVTYKVSVSGLSRALAALKHVTDTRSRYLSFRDVQEAGGRVTDMAGKPMRLRAGPILASCGGQLHERVLSLLREAECTGEESDLR